MLSGHEENASGASDSANQGGTTPPSRYQRNRLSDSNRQRERAIAFDLYGHDGAPWLDEYFSYSPEFFIRTAITIISSAGLGTGIAELINRIGG